MSPRRFWIICREYGAVCGLVQKKAANPGLEAGSARPNALAALIGHIPDGPDRRIPAQPSQ